MQQVIDTIKKLASTSSSNEKKEILRKNINSDIQEIFHTTYSRNVYNVKKLKNPIKKFASESSLQEFKILRDRLKNRIYTGDAAQDAIHTFCANYSTQECWETVFFPALKKDLRCGVTSTIYNHIAGELGYKQIVLFSPMGAVSTNREDKYLGEKIWQPKYDGVRANVFLYPKTGRVEIRSRNDKPYLNFKKIEESFLKNKEHFLLYDVVMFDGEIISDDFQTLSTQLQRKDNAQCDDAIFMMFDVIFDEITDTVLENRLENIKHVLENYIVEDNIKQTESFYVNNYTRNQFLKIMEQQCAKGMEGIVVKDRYSEYLYEKNIAWIKMKSNETADLKIIDIVEGTGKYVGMCGAIVCEGIHEDTFISVSVGSGLSDDDRKEFWNNREKYIAKIVEIKYDSITKSKGSESYSLRFPRYIKTRPDKD
jgi:DNA ligase-1